MAKTPQGHRLRLGLIYGGRSGEHEISLRSARAVLEALDGDKYEVVLIGIDPEGRWHRHSGPEFRRLTAASLPRIAAGAAEVVLPPVPSAGALLRLQEGATAETRLDVVFPILHGTFGEDGTIQGLLELADVAYVGAGVLGSALGMDKDVQKRLLRAAGLPVVDFFALRRHQWEAEPAAWQEKLQELGTPVFVKPANLGSSVGISKVAETPQLQAALHRAFEYDEKVVVERGVDAREIECSVLGNQTAEASVLGEVCPRQDFYSYEAKYVDAEGASFLIPAPLPAERTDEIRRMAITAFHTIECEGMARVDFFLERASQRVFINELNTIPGFTAISQYPKLWEASGLSFTALLDRLVELAIERHERRRQLKKTRC